MTETTTTALIAEARTMGTEDRADNAAMIERLADALEATLPSEEAVPRFPGIGYIDKTIDNCQDLPEGTTWENGEVLEMLDDIRSELVAAGGVQAEGDCPTGCGTPTHLTQHDEGCGGVQAEPERTLTYGRDVRNTGNTGRPDDGFTSKGWHQAAVDDTGVSHTLPGRLYVVQCEWCPKAFAAGTKAEAVEMFREHESDMLDTDGATS